MTHVCHKYWQGIKMQKNNAMRQPSFGIYSIINTILEFSLFFCTQCVYHLLVNSKVHMLQ